MPRKKLLILCNKDLDRYRQRSSSFQDSTGEFFDSVFRSSWSRLMYGNTAEINRREYISKMRKIRILIDKYFIGKEKFMLQVLCTSANPIYDISNCLSISCYYVYRKLNYLRDILRALYNYSENSDYDSAIDILKICLTNRRFSVFSLYMICRNYTLVGRMLGITRLGIRGHVYKVLNFLRDNRNHKDLEDLYNVCCYLKDLRYIEYR